MRRSKKERKRENMDFQEKSKKGHAKAAVHNTPSISYYFVVLTFLDTFFLLRI
jgi:hypothetical protein